MNYILSEEFEEYSKDLPISLSHEKYRVLSQVLAGGNLVGRVIARAEVEALAAYMTRRIDQCEYQRRVALVRRKIREYRGKNMRGGLWTSSRTNC